MTVTDRYNREITPEDAHSDAFFERAPQARENFALHTRPPSADVGARPSAPWHTHGCLSPPAAPRTDRPPPWPVRLETFTQATAPPLRYHVNALARPCRRLRTRGRRLADDPASESSAATVNQSWRFFGSKSIQSFGPKRAPIIFYIYLLCSVPGPVSIEMF